jgi:hypothetical protein
MTGRFGQLFGELLLIPAFLLPKSAVVGSSMKKKMHSSHKKAIKVLAFIEYQCYVFT